MRIACFLALVIAAAGCHTASAADDWQGARENRPGGFARESWQGRAKAYQRALIREARLELGLNAPIPLFAGQIHQESLWRPDARSAYANGLTQFTPETEAWIKTVFPQELGVGNAFNSQWAIRALVKYDHWLYQHIKAANDCERWAMTLSAYNGGLGWLQRDQRLTAQRGGNPAYWWGSVERYSRRAKWAIKENRGYPRAIIYAHQPHYLGWGGVRVCAPQS